jgi:hypothetical protein
VVRVTRPVSFIKGYVSRLLILFTLPLPNYETDFLTFTLTCLQLNPEPGHRILRNHIIRALFKQDAQERNLSLDQILHPEVRICL